MIESENHTYVWVRTADRLPDPYLPTVGLLAGGVYGIVAWSSEGLCWFRPVGDGPDLYKNDVMAWIYITSPPREFVREAERL